MQLKARPACTRKNFAGKVEWRRCWIEGCQDSQFVKVDREYLRQRSDVGVACARSCTWTREEHARTENTESHVGAHKSVPGVGGGPRRALPSIDRYLNEYSSVVRDPLWNQSRRHNGSFRRAPISPADRLSWIQNFTCHVVRGLSSSETIAGRGWHGKVVFRLSHARTRSHTFPRLRPYYASLSYDNFLPYNYIIWFSVL